MKTREACVIGLFLAAVTCSYALSPPQYTLQRKLKGTVGAHPQVTVHDVREEGLLSIIDVESASASMREGLAFILTPDYNFGGIQVRVRVVDGQGNETPGGTVPGGIIDPAAFTRGQFEKALTGNPLFSQCLEGGFFQSFFVELRARVVQYWNDDLSDPRGNSDLMAETAFLDVCRHTFFDGNVIVAFCTEPVGALAATTGLQLF